MPLTKPEEFRRMTPQERKEKLKELREELMRERGIGAMGGAPLSPGKIRALRRSLAKLLTIMREKGEV